MPPKRTADGESKTLDLPLHPPSQFQAAFEHFRAELDEHHDRKERITKSSRDITAASKKVYVYGIES